ncbi:gag-pol polyprotein [Trichonephila clavipes]|nr:gag-pol polyprotein [Trichonephila clavipes]
MFWEFPRFGESSTARGYPSADSRPIRKADCVSKKNPLQNTEWYWARTRDKANHGPIPIPLGYRGLFSGASSSDSCFSNGGRSSVDYFCRPRATWSVTDWRRVIFSDESRFSLSADDHRTRVRGAPASGPIRHLLSSGIQQFHKRCKQALADAALLAHPSPSAPLALHVDASDYAIGGKSDKCSPRQIRQLDFISQFTTNIVHIPGSDNIAADVLSRVSAITFPSQIDYDCIAETQQTDQELHTLIASGTSLELKKLSGQDTAQLAKNPKIHRHTRSPLSSFQEPSQRFDHVHLDLIGHLPPSNGYTYCLTMIDRFSKWSEAQPQRHNCWRLWLRPSFPLGCLALELLQFSQPTGAGSLSPRLQSS